MENTPCQIVKKPHSGGKNLKCHTQGTRFFTYDRGQHVRLKSKTFMPLLLLLFIALVKNYPQESAFLIMTHQLCLRRECNTLFHCTSL